MGPRPCRRTGGRRRIEKVDVTPHVNTSYAPDLLIYEVSDWPSVEHRFELRAELIANGHLLDHTAALVNISNLTNLPTDDDLRVAFQDAAGHGLRACVVSTAEQQEFVERVQRRAIASLRIALFSDEREAIRWLLTGARTKARVQRG